MGRDTSGSWLDSALRPDSLRPQFSPPGIRDLRSWELLVELQSSICSSSISGRFLSTTVLFYPFPPLIHRFPLNPSKCSLRDRNMVSSPLLLHQCGQSDSFPDRPWNQVGPLDNSYNSILPLTIIARQHLLPRRASFPGRILS